MECPSCGHKNREGATFCGECGVPLADKVACPSCGTPNPRAQKFCDACGARLPDVAPATPDPRSYTPAHLVEKILRDRSTMEGERRTVTALFADAVGSTPMAERLGEEQIYALMQGCMARMLDAVHRYEGTVTQFRGDGVLALFGAPIAHEDAARRAVAAALEMQEALGEYAEQVRTQHPIECRFRVGLNSGPVVVGKIGDDLSMEFTAIGDTVNLAARMEQMAEPGSVYVTENTFRQVRDYFELEPLGALIVKGKSEPVVAYKAVRHRPTLTRFEAAAERGLTPFVGRRQDVEMLRSYFERARRGAGQVVFVSGEAGIGKSRLLLELRRALPSHITWLEGHCISYGRNISYLPIIDVLKRAFGVEEGDDDTRIIERVHERTAAWDGPARATVPYLKYLLNVDPGDPEVSAMDPRERRAGIFDGLRALLIQESRERPLVVVVEDLHWVDEMSEEALHSLVDVVAAAPVLLILTYRPGYAHSLGERTYYSRVALTHLAAEESATMCARVLQVDTLPDPVQRLVVGKAEGNPFFIEEVTKSLVETGVLGRSNGSFTLQRPIEEVSIPDTIQEVILSRIDRLERQAKEAIQLASVIGREFTVRLLRRISDLEAKLEDSLQELKVLELIYEKTYFPELSYMFKHALTHDVAYSTLLQERRRALHRIVASAVEELYADRLPEQYEALAHHYSQAEVWDKALEYLVKAGDKAREAYANPEALDFYAKALEACDRLRDPTSAADVAGARGMLNLGIGNLVEGVADFDLMRARALAVEDRAREGQALLGRGVCQIWIHDVGDAESCLRTALAIGEEVGSDELRFGSLVWLYFLFIAFGRLDEAREIESAVEEIASTVGDPRNMGYWLALRAFEENWKGRYDAALEGIERARPVAEESGDASEMIAIRWEAAVSLAGKGEYQRSLALLEELLPMADRIGEVLYRARALNTVGWVYGELQDHEPAMEWNRRSIEAALAINAPDPEIESNAFLNMGDSLSMLGRLDEAEEYYGRVERVVRDPRPQDHFALWLYSQHFFASFGDLWLRKGDPEKALGLAEECIALAESTGRRKNAVKGHRLRGQALTALGRLDEAEVELLAALEGAREVGNPPQLWKTLVALGALRGAQGRPEEARAACDEAISVIEGAAAGLTDERLRETFLSSAHVRGIREAARSLTPPGGSGAQAAKRQPPINEGRGNGSARRRSPRRRS